MRLFIAVDFPEDVKSALMDYQSRLQDMGATGRFVRRDTLHLTLHFLGETPSSRLAAAKKAVTDAASQCKSFALVTSLPVSFDKGRGGSVLWLGLEKNKALIDLHRCLEDALVKQGFVRDTKIFRPHITMARDADWISQLPKLNRLTIPAKGITLFESRRDTVTGCYRYIPLQVTDFVKDDIGK